jgi:hypothetical protein
MEIGVGCFEQSGEDNAASGDAIEKQRQCHWRGGSWRGRCR